MTVIKKVRNACDGVKVNIKAQYAHKKEGLHDKGNIYDDKEMQVKRETEYPKIRVIIKLYIYHAGNDKVVHNQMNFGD